MDMISNGQKEMLEDVNDLGDALEINTEKPDDIEAENGCYSFVVSKEKIRCCDTCCRGQL